MKKKTVPHHNLLLPFVHFFLILNLLITPSKLCTFDFLFESRLLDDFAFFVQLRGLLDIFRPYQGETLKIFTRDGVCELLYFKFGLKRGGWL